MPQHGRVRNAGCTPVRGLLESAQTPPRNRHDHAMKLSLSSGTLAADGTPLLEGLDPAFSLKGAFLSLPAPGKAEGHGVGPWRHVPLGRPARVAAYAGQIQRSPFWFHPAQGASLSELKNAASWLLLKRDDGLFVLLVPLPAGNASSYLVADPDGTSRLYRSTGNPALAPTGGRVLHVAAGRDPRSLLAESARAVARALPAAALRADKPSPPFADFLGWCTWNAFYKEVSAERVLGGLARFRDAGLRPGFVIVDDGWQRETPPKPASVRYLAGFGTDEAKFPGGFGPVVRAAKRRFGVRRVLAWLAPQGLPAGVDPGAFRRYRPVRSAPQPDAHVDLAGVFSWFDSKELNLPGDWLAFLRDRFAELRAAGIDGVKVDFQGVLFFCAARSRASSRPGECARMRTALETAATEAFGDQWLSCMAHLPEIWYHARRNNLTRGSDDFFPGIPASHGAHVRANAFTGLWFGHFMGVDWDMFQSKHPFGAYHAAARALSGGPVYTADAPEGIDAALLRRVALADGRVPRFPDPATPSLRSLFPEPGDDPRAFVVVNAGPAAGAAGLFDAETAAPARAVRAKVRPADIPGLPAAARYAVWDGRSRPRLVAPESVFALSAASRDRFAIATVSPVLGGRFAAFGLADMLVPAATVLEAAAHADGVFAVRLAGPGRFAAWCASRPASLRSGWKDVPFSWDRATGLLLADVPAGRISVSFAERPARGRQAGR